MTTHGKPRIGISIGDPAGIGPELIAKLLQDKELKAQAEMRVMADPRYLECQAEIIIGHSQALAGDIAVKSFLLAIDLALAGKIDAVVTAPLDKQAMHLAGYHYQGHTEILAEKTGGKKATMFFYSEPLKVVLITMHTALRDVPSLLTSALITAKSKLAIEFLKTLGIDHPRVAVCGLNPHAGENGLFGDEEARLIAPAVHTLRQEGFDVQGPFPADTVFYQAYRGHYDLVVAHYHDQGLIPVKLLAFDSAVNVTLGTPVFRASPDHGTAYDIAGQGVANPGSMKSAVQLAVKWCKMRGTKGR